MNAAIRASIFVLLSALALNDAARAEPAAGPGPGACAHAFMPGGHGHGWVMDKMMDTLTPQQRVQAHELMRQSRLADLKYRQEIMDQHFALERVALEPKWDEAAAAEHAHLLGRAVAQLALEKMRLRHELRALTAPKGGAPKK